MEQGELPPKEKGAKSRWDVLWTILAVIILSAVMGLCSIISKGTNPEGFRGEGHTENHNAYMNWEVPGSNKKVVLFK